jgi:hypothetical protein
MLAILSMSAPCNAWKSITDDSLNCAIMCSMSCSSSRSEGKLGLRPSEAKEDLRRNSRSASELR